MTASKRIFVEADDYVLDHDTWNYSLPKRSKSAEIELGPVFGVLPFKGVRNPSALSSWSHKSFFTYRTAADNWQPRIGMTESAAETAVGLEGVMAPNVYDVEFQPVTVPYVNEVGDNKTHTFDLRFTFRSGRRRLIFVRYEESLTRASTKRDIAAIIAATPRAEADDVCVVNASIYTRQRRDNIYRMHHFFFRPDREADEEVLQAARDLKTLYRMKDIFPHVSVSQPRAFASCYRLVAKRQLGAKLDNVLWENSHVWVIA